MQKICREIGVHLVIHSSDLKENLPNFAHTDAEKSKNRVKISKKL